MLLHSDLPVLMGKHKEKTHKRKHEDSDSASDDSGAYNATQCAMHRWLMASCTIDSLPSLMLSVAETLRLSAAAIPNDKHGSELYL